ncbi:hypothetical protein PPYR_11561 [Photinus pyralis]|uniref:Ionotropic glutamate receptor L-glutamate and glycine-binding domain-containing protein n=1 Tax=Photinus pyralis TaxID=7054 RepID=A0A5N4ABN0_PHOPY|nr:uncharacterized protein LOC116175642 [Photinus pyralis]KAB0794722.1 hypothetical protein PPYR_11561 [Photinus pyralis]
MKCGIFTILLFNLTVIQSKRYFANFNINPSNAKESSFNALIRHVIASSMEKKCVVIICDHIYYKMLDWEYFTGARSHFAHFIVIVEESEDLLAPADASRDVLKVSSEHGCEFYIILISNAIQSSRLLKYGERYRTVNTRARFLILHDYRLFQMDLHYLWEKIINVIFIKELVRKKGQTEEEVLLYELSTVPFPFPIKAIMVPRRLAIWRGTPLHSDIELYKDKTIDLKNQTLHITVFSHLPASVKKKTCPLKSHRASLSTHSRTFQGIEIEILETLAVSMNFVPQIYEPKDVDTELWGAKGPDGKYTGILGEMVANRADMALGDLQYTHFFLKLMDLSVPYNTECLTFLTPESLTTNSWKTLILPFRLQLWLAILSSLGLMAGFFHALCYFHDKVNELKYEELQAQKLALKNELDQVAASKRFNPKQTYGELKKQYLLPTVEGEPVGLYLFRKIGSSILYTYGMLLVIALPKLPTGWSIRVLTGWYWIYCILIVVAYKASMTAILAKPESRVTIDTLQELINSKLAVGGWGEVNVEFFRTSLDVPTQIIGSRFEKLNDSDDAIDRVVEGNFALYENEYYLQNAVVKKQLRYQQEEDELKGNKSLQIQKIPKGDHYLHIMSDCMIHMPISIGLKKNSPLKYRVDTLVRRIFEVGLVKKWLDDIMQQTANDEVHYQGSEAVKAVMDMQKFMGALVALAIGYFISFIVLLSEILHFEMNIKKHPDFNKYTKQISKSK